MKRKRPTRAMKATPPGRLKEDPFKIIEEIRKKYGRKMTMADIEELLADRYEEIGFTK